MSRAGREQCDAVGVGLIGLGTVGSGVGSGLVRGLSLGPDWSNPGFEMRQQPLHLPIGICEPVGRPNPIDLPPQTFEDHLPQPVPVTHRYRRVVCSAIAFDAKDEAVGVVRMPDTEIDAIASDADLGHRLVTMDFDPRFYEILEGALGRSLRVDFTGMEPAGGGIFKIGAQNPDTLRLTFGMPHIAGFHRRKHPNLTSCPGK